MNYILNRLRLSTSLVKTTLGGEGGVLSFFTKMGIYFETSTVTEDANYILEGIAKGEITTDFFLVQSPEVLTEDKEKSLVWISNKDPRQHLVHRDYKDTVVINNIKGKLTEMSCSYIRRCLLNEKRLGTTLDPSTNV